MPRLERQRDSRFTVPGASISPELALFRRCFTLIEERKPGIKLSRGTVDSRLPLFRAPPPLIEVVTETLEKGRMPYGP